MLLHDLASTTDGGGEEVHQGLPRVADACDDEVALSLLLSSLDALPLFPMFLPFAVGELSFEVSELPLSASSFSDSPVLRFEWVVGFLFFCLSDSLSSLSLPSTEISSDVCLECDPSPETGPLPFFSASPSDPLSDGDVTSAEEDDALSEVLLSPEIEPDDAPVDSLSDDETEEDPEDADESSVDDVLLDDDAEISESEDALLLAVSSCRASRVEESIDSLSEFSCVSARSLRSTISTLDTYRLPSCSGQNQPGRKNSKPGNFCSSFRWWAIIAFSYVDGILECIRTHQEGSGIADFRMRHKTSPRQISGKRVGVDDAGEERTISRYCMSEILVFATNINNCWLAWRGRRSV